MYHKNMAIKRWVNSSQVLYTYFSKSCRGHRFKEGGEGPQNNNNNNNNNKQTTKQYQLQLKGHASIQKNIKDFPKWCIKVAETCTAWEGGSWLSLPFSFQNILYEAFLLVPVLKVSWWASTLCSHAPNSLSGMIIS